MDKREYLHKNAFTLIELLVVIAILGILFAIMVPALSKSRSLARRASCLNNLRQLYFAMLSYADDHNGILPTVAAFNYDILLSYLDNDKEITRCPEVNGYYDSDIMSYGYNEFVAGLKPDAVSTSKSETVLFCDSDRLTVYYSDDPDLTRHGTIGLAAYVDGHAAPIDIIYLDPGTRGGGGNSPTSP